MPGEVKRAVRVSGRLREEMSRQLAALRDPRLAGVVVTRVEMTDDLQLARIYVRASGAAGEGTPAGDDDRAQRAVLSGLGAAGPRLRRNVAQAVGLRYAPNLRFFWDESPEAVNRIEELLREIHAERDDRDDE
ncbi:MAG: 30S ribosome-binding factor RbfA [Polyangiaceae bacterium]